MTVSVVAPAASGTPWNEMNPVKGSEPGSKKPAGMGVAEKSCCDPIKVSYESNPLATGPAIACEKTHIPQVSATTKAGRKYLLPPILVRVDMSILLPLMRQIVVPSHWLHLTDKSIRGFV